MRTFFLGRAAAAAVAIASALALSAPQPASAHPGAWKSGVRHNSAAAGFITWRGTSAAVAVGFIPWRDGWGQMLTYAGGSGPRSVRSLSSNVSFGHALFPSGGDVSACAGGSYDSNHREVARRLAAGGNGDAEIRLGWEANGDWYPWSITSSNVETWKECFTRIANIFKSQSANYRIAWSMNKKGRVDVRTAWPADAPITNICISNYDDPWNRFGYETFMGGPWGLEAWADFARSKGRKFCVSEWGVGREGDNPSFIQGMHDFFEKNASTIAHESYQNANGVADYRLSPSTKWPTSAALYQNLF